MSFSNANVFQKTHPTPQDGQNKATSTCKFLVVPKIRNPHFDFVGWLLVAWFSFASTQKSFLLWPRALFLCVQTQEVVIIIESGGVDVVDQQDICGT